jgi:hypothetical protein
MNFTEKQSYEAASIHIGVLILVVAYTLIMAVIIALD